MISHEQYEHLLTLLRRIEHHMSQQTDAAATLETAATTLTTIATQIASTLADPPLDPALAKAIADIGTAVTALQSAVTPPPTA